MILRLIVTLCFVSPVVFAAEYSPVLLFGGNGQAAPALSLMSSERFLEVAKAGDAMNVAFVQKDSDRESFLDCTTDIGETCYSGLKTIQGKNYYRQVENPVDALEKGIGRCKILNTNAEGRLLAPIEFVPKSCIIVNLFGSLQASDALITKFINENKDENIVAFYTPNVVKSRVTRATAVAEGSDVFSSKDPGFLMFYEQLKHCVYDSTKKSEEKRSCDSLKYATMKISNSTSKSFSVTLEGADENIASLTFDIKYDSGYFEMQNLQLGSSKFRAQSDVNAPTTFSYYCGNKTFYQYDTKDVNVEYLVFNSLQMQAPFKKEVFAEKFSFSDPWHCVPFVSIPILAGLFVVAILLTILGVGICWLMDINTMDRFDDPKGKTITINAQE